jgi:hypothetical protein
MIRQIPLQWMSLLVLTLSPLTMGFESFASPSQSSSVIALKFPNTGNRGKPKHSAGGGVRGDQDNCLSQDATGISLAAILPNRENITQTTLDNPRLPIFIAQTQAKSGELVITDRNNREVYVATYPLPQRSGIIQLDLPAKAKLQPNQTYNWSFMVVCDLNYRNRDYFIQGQLTYTEPDPSLSKQLQGSSNLEKAEKYAASQLWFETMTQIEEIRRTNPQQGQELWGELLKSVGLEPLASAPILDCCTAK